MGDVKPSSDAIEVALATVLSSAAFCGRPRLRRLLTHLVRHSIAGHGDLLKEYTLGVEVFDRGIRFDPQCDAIVRVEVFNLRQALREYYRSEGATDAVTISVPKGGYRANFHMNEEPPAAILDDPERLCSQVEWSHLQGSGHDLARIQHYVQHARARWPNRPDLHVALASVALATLELEHGSPVDQIGVMRQAANAALRREAARGDAAFYATIHQIRGPNKEAAIAAAHRWLDVAPRSALAHFWVGSTVASSGKMDQAVLYLQRAARLQPYATFFETWFAVGLFCTGRPDAGLRHLRGLLAFDPHDYLPNYWLGLLASHARRFDEARDAAARAYEVSGCTQALAALGYVEAASGSVERAEAVLDALAHHQNGYVARCGISQIYVALGRLDRAAREWTRGQAEGDWEMGWAVPDPRWNALRGKVPGI